MEYEIFWKNTYLLAIIQYASALAKPVWDNTSKEEIKKKKILCRIKKVIKRETNTTIVKNL